MILNVLSCVSNREVKMTLKQGDLIPEINFCFRVGDSRPDSGTCPTGGKFVEKTTGELFSNKKILIFSLPGAFTPTCSTYQLPNFEKLYPNWRRRLYSTKTYESH